MKKNLTKKGFSLVELIIATAIIVIVVLSATSLLVSIMRSNAGNINRLTAYGLAQEGMEAMRNIRDSNWLLGATFEGKVGSTVQPWNAVLPDSESKTYIIEFREFDHMLPAKDSAGLLNVTPWNLQEISATEDLATSEKTLLYKQTFQAPTETRYTHSASGEETIFHRYVTVEREEKNKYRVTCVVNWNESSGGKEVRLDTELTDWKENQL